MTEEPSVAELRRAMHATYRRLLNGEVSSTAYAAVLKRYVAARNAEAGWR